MYFQSAGCRGIAAVDARRHEATSAAWAFQQQQCRSVVPNARVSDKGGGVEVSVGTDVFF
jgi:hypothetical protein